MTKCDDPQVHFYTNIHYWSEKNKLFEICRVVLKFEKVAILSVGDDIRRQIMSSKVDPCPKY